MHVAEIFRGKKIFLNAPNDVSEVVSCVRYIPLLSEIASELSLIISDTNGLEELIQSTFPDVKVFLPNVLPPFQHDLELDLAKLPLLFNSDSDMARQCYLHPPPDTLARFNNIMEKSAGMTNIGLALYGNPEKPLIDSTTIAQNITLNQRHNTTFFFIPADPDQSESKPPYSNFQDTAGMVHNYCELAALLASLDIIISFDNDVAHLATALGKPLWLLAPHSANTGKLDSWAKFSNVTIFRQPPSGSWKEVIQTIALFRFIQPENPFFVPFSTDNMALEQAAALPAFPTFFFENTSQLTQVLDAELAVFTSVSIETTTVCNLKCSYCPHSTDVAKPPAFMPDDMFFRIIDSLYDYAPTYSGIITPSMYGEPLLDKRFESFIRYARKKFPQAHMELFTNGDFLTPERFFSLREAGIDQYNISQHSPNRSQALSDTLATVEREFNGVLPITINKMLEQNKFNRAGLVDVGLPLEIYGRMAYCDAAYPNLSFDYKGDAIICCNDYQAKHSFGNISSKSVREIWENKRYRRARNMLMLGFLPFQICRACMYH